MQTLNSLHAMILEHKAALGINHQSVDVFMERGRLERGSHKEDERGLHYLDFRYSLALAIENMHADRAAPLLIWLHQWVGGLDNRADLAEPDIVVTNTSSKLADVEMTLEVRDGIYLARDPAGEINALGEQWTLGTHTMDVAEEFSISGAIKGAI
ncbi:phage tail protein [Oceanobacter mangrovi]|uniref:phage tail protein n=1 Tax=Oceanobacter mangrovi TaxID=2862510 RepID=UPI001C8E9D6D|nr:phage tail protein [Oceanobacter mangrovi]